MGISGGTKTKTQTKEQATTTPNIPAYAQPAITGYFDQVASLGKTLTPEMFQTPANDTLTKAFDSAKNLGGWQSGLNSSTALANKVANATVNPANVTSAGPVNQVTASSLLDTPIANYLNPITDELVTNSLASFDDEAGRREAMLAAQGARAGAFGGSRFGIAEAQQGADLARERGLLDAGLRSAAYDRATGLAQFDAANRQGANVFNAGASNDFSLFNAGQKNETSRFNADLARQRLADQLAAAGLISSNAATGGSLAQGDAAAQLAAGNAQRQLDLANQLAPLAAAEAYGGLLDPAMLAAISGQTINSSGTSTTKQSGGLLGQLLGAGAQLGSAALLASERRVKRDIERIGALPDGLGVYAYRYLWDRDDEPLREGVMVDEVAELRPWALGPVVDGIQTVDYGRL